MKRIAILLLAAWCLVSCDKGDTRETAPKVGQYVYADGTITAAVHLDNHNGVRVTVFENGRYVYQNIAGHIAVSTWPSYRYDFSGQVDELILSCSYSSGTAFSATIEANATGVPLPAAMQFAHNSKVLDANGDGILDE